MAFHSQSDRLRTSFQPSPSPVVVQKRSGQPHLVGDRLALAVRLARRDLQHGLVHRSAYISTSQALPNSSHVQFSVESVRSEGGGMEMEEDIAKTKRDDTCSRGGGGGVTDLRHLVKGSGVKDDGDGDGVSEDVKGGAKTSRQVSDELVQLKLELNHQVQRLRELCARKTVCGGIGEEEEREKRRSAEQVAMMARKLYDLRHQVCATGVKGKPPPCRKRLAAARRAATRALHNYTSTPHPLPSELLQVVEVLCGRGDRQSAQLLSLAQMYSDTLRSTHQQGRCGSPPQQSTVKHKQKKNPGRRVKRRQQCGVTLPKQSLRARRGGFVHFSQPTLSSTARSRPSVRCSTHTPPQVRDTEHAELTMNSERSRRRAKQGRVRQLRAPTAPAAIDDGVGGEEGVDEGSEDEGNGQRDDRSSPSETKAIAAQQAQRGSSSETSPPPRYSPCPHSSSSPDLSDPLGSTVEECQSLKDRRAVDLPNLVAMATTLQQMEEVEVEIRQKWNGRSYTEPLGGHHPSNTGFPPSPSSPPSSCSGRSEWTLSNIALVDRGEFELWQLIKRLADDLLEESIHAVCEEVGEICSGLTKDIFSSEFVTPTMH